MNDITKDVKRFELIGENEDGSRHLIASFARKEDAETLFSFMMTFPLHEMWQDFMLISISETTLIDKSLDAQEYQAISEHLDIYCYEYEHYDDEVKDDGYLELLYTACKKFQGGNK